MPIPGPRSQAAPLPGYRNPERELPNRINLWGRPAPFAQAGRSPGLMAITRRGDVLAPGQVRDFYRQLINQVGAQAAYSWTRMSPSPEHPFVPGPAIGITRALRYMARSFYVGSGVDNTRFAGLHTNIAPRQRRSAQARGKRVTVAAGSVRGRPTVRNRMTSFGSRVQTLNEPVPGAE